VVLSLNLHWDHRLAHASVRAVYSQEPTPLADVRLVMSSRTIMVKIKAHSQLKLIAQS
jgi:hypothetical protein